MRTPKHTHRSLFTLRARAHGAVSKRSGVSARFCSASPSWICLPSSDRTSQGLAVLGSRRTSAGRQTQFIWNFITKVTNKRFFFNNYGNDKRLLVSAAYNIPINTVSCHACQTGQNNRERRVTDADLHTAASSHALENNENI